MKHDQFIAVEGLPMILPLAGATLLALVAGFRGLGLVLLLLTLFVLWFFRNPQRKTPEKEKLVISPADGKVIRIEETASEEQPGKTCLKISIFMNIFNVHVNRIPYSGRVRFIRYRSGKFLSANLDKASALNERNTVMVQTDDGKEIITVQIAGLIARRIICGLRIGDAPQRGQRFGMICFGSRLDVYLPPDARLNVRVGEKVQAGTSILGRLPES